MKYEELDRIYSENFSIGYLNPPKKGEQTSFERKLILISLICAVTYKTQLKKPDVTHYQVIMKVSQRLGLPEEFIKGLSIVCKDFGYQCTEFPTFGLKGQEILKEIREILSTYIPF